MELPKDALVVALEVLDEKIQDMEHSQWIDTPYLNELRESSAALHRYVEGEIL